MANQILAGAVINAGMIIAGVDADNPPVTETNIALTATSTASTHISNLPPSLAHDGIIGISDTDGSTISGVNAWVTTAEGVGAWMQLDWSTPQIVHKIKLYDRPNVTHDHIKGGTLTFSDGSSVTVGELPDGVVNGAPDPLEVTFDAKTITWVRFTVDAFTGHNAGLTEFEVFGYEYQAPAPEPEPEPYTDPVWPVLLDRAVYNSTEGTGSGTLTFGDWTYGSIFDNGQGTRHPIGTVTDQGLRIQAPHWSGGDWWIEPDTSGKVQVEIIGRYDNFEGSYSRIDLFLTNGPVDSTDTPDLVIVSEGTQGSDTFMVYAYLNGNSRITIRTLNTINGVSTIEKVTLL